MKRNVVTRTLNLWNRCIKDRTRVRTLIGKREQIAPKHLCLFQADAKFDPMQLVKTDAGTHANPLEVSDLGTLDRDLLLLLTRLIHKLGQLHKAAARQQMQHWTDELELASH